MRELVIPPAAFEDADSIEFIRFWVAGGQDHVSLHIGGMGEHDHEAMQWGMMLADISTHIVRGMVQDGSPDSEEVLRAKIEQGYLTRLKRKDVNFTGSLLGTRQ